MQIETHTSSTIDASPSVYDFPKKRIETGKTPYDEYFGLPEGAPYQLIAGKLVMTPSPIPLHQNISGHLYFELLKYVENEAIGQVFVAPLDVCFDEENIYQPDILFIRKENENIIGKTMIEGPPDLVVEVLSPSTAYYDLRTKFRVYEKSGVQEYWIVDPERRSVEVYTNQDGKFSRQSEVEGSGEVQSKIISGFFVQIDTIFP